MSGFQVWPTISFPPPGTDKDKKQCDFDRRTPRACALSLRCTVSLARTFTSGGGAVTTSSGAETGDFSRSGARSSISPGPQLYFLSTRSASEGGPGTFSAASGCGWSSKLPGRQRGRRSGARPLFGAACPAVRRCRGFRPGSHPAVAPCLPKGGSRGGPACMGCLDGIRGPLSPPRNVSGPHPTGQGTTIPQTGSRHPPLALEAAG